MNPDEMKFCGQCGNRLSVAGTAQPFSKWSRNHILGVIIGIALLIPAIALVIVTFTELSLVMRTLESYPIGSPEQIAYDHAQSITGSAFSIPFFVLATYLLTRKYKRAESKSD